MKTLLKEKWDDKYYNYIVNLRFADTALKSDFLKLLKCKDSKKRELMWGDLCVKINDLQEVWKLSNPYYIGFGNPDSDILFIGKDGSFKSSLSTIYQTFDGVDLYPSIEEKAANLLYFITKNYSLTDGNKRMAVQLVR
jgi:hypothetical protein